MRYTMTEKQAGENGLNCGGTVCEFIPSELMLREVGKPLPKLKRPRRGGRLVFLATELNGQRRLLTDEQGNILWSIGDCPPQVHEDAHRYQI